jgi:hypothetical protein
MKQFSDTSAKQHPYVLTDGPCKGGTVWAYVRQTCIMCSVPVVRDSWYERDVSPIEWKDPEALYERNAEGVFRYKHTVHYKPREGGQIEVQGDVAHATLDTR